MPRINEEMKVDLEEVEDIARELHALQERKKIPTLKFMLLIKFVNDAVLEESGVTLNSVTKGYEEPGPLDA